MTVETAPGGQKLDVRLDWSGVPGDSTTPRDVRQYVVYRRLSGATTRTAIASRPTLRTSSYRYQDFALPVAAGTCQYGRAARDCSGLSAARSVTATVTFA